MRRQIHLLFVLLLVIGLAPAAFAAPADAPSRGGPPERETLIVTFDEDVVPEVAAQGLARAFGGAVRHVYERAINGAAIDLPAPAAAAVGRLPAVVRVENDLPMELLGGGIGTQMPPVPWGLARIDQHDVLGEDGWSYSYPVSAGAGVTAYVFDSGIRGSHDEFVGRIVKGFSPFRGRSSNPNQDCDGHGTHVAGTIGGVDFGVAKQVSLSSVRVFDCNGRGFASDLIAGIEWAINDVDGRPAVANFSLGFAGLVSSVDAAVENLIDAGVVVAIAAGNGDASGNPQDACDFSPHADRALIVSATDVRDQRASWANIGNCVDLFAPGVSITSAWNTGDSAWNTISGTSMAAPHVAGVAALLLADVSFDGPDAVATRIALDATQNIVGGAQYPNNLLFSSLSQGGGTAEPPPQPSVTVESIAVSGNEQDGGLVTATNTTVEVTVSNDGNVDLSEVSIAITPSSTSSTTFEDPSVVSLAGGLATGTTQTATFTWNTSGLGAGESVTLGVDVVATSTDETVDAQGSLDLVVVGGQGDSGGGVVATATGVTVAYGDERQRGPWSSRTATVTVEGAYLDEISITGEWDSDDFGSCTLLEGTDGDFVCDLPEARWKNEKYPSIISVTVYLPSGEVKFNL